MSDISVSVVVTPQDALALWDRLREGRQWASADALWEWLQGRSQPVVREFTSVVAEMVEADTLATLLDNVVMAESLSRELREQAHDRARSYLYDRRQRLGTLSRPAVREFINELGNRIKITIEGPFSVSENILTPMETAELAAALSSRQAVQS